ncbi:PEP-CTERM sorting domain-containing protein [Ruficoccus amylovorans]|uniref:PEP-CTERM sorting domain-containing protein n=1 Tax=Ruficoccus amylovorans TaxID=1804625 RepID=A0A842HI52_9BACT|nr:PEP-CTERM sorting domain-containing protein [Ruficoccus amylovorans]MBC2595266.1 PEP-CTERM sorting domain-containing protein [Ruficoccus amylovorans]
MKSCKWFTLLASFACGAATMSYGAINTATGFETPDTGVSNNAQLSGLTASYGSFDGADVGLSAWEKFSSPTFSGLAAQYTAGGMGLNATLSQSNSGAGLSDELSGTSNTGLIDVGGTNYYGRLVTGGYDFTIDGVADYGISSITLQIKHTPFFDAEFNPMIAFDAELSYGGITLSPDSITEGANLGNFSDAIGMSMNNGYYEYTWSNLNIGALEAFLIDFSSLEDQLGFGFSVDTIALQVTSNAVPEPSTWALMISGAVFAFVALRRRAAQSKAAALAA